MDVDGPGTYLHLSDRRGGRFVPGSSSTRIPEHIFGVEQLTNPEGFFRSCDVTEKIYT